jgi:protein kinase D
MAGSEITFMFQFGSIRDIITTNSGLLTFDKLKELASEFITSKVSKIVTTY